MSLSLTSTATAIAPGMTASFLGVGGVEPYAYAVLSGGGTIDPTTGRYTAPAVANADPKLSSAIIQVTDDDGDTATASILVADPLQLVCEIIERQMGLASGRVFLWNQKVMQPTDSGLFVAVSVLNCKPFANTVALDPSGAGLDAIQSINMVATLSFDIISRSTAALLRKEEILLALASLYSQSQQQANSFFIGKLPTGGQFVNLSHVDGAAIPYRFNISVTMQYFVKKIQAASYFDEFESVGVETES